MRIVAVAVNHQVYVHVPQARQNRHAFGRDNLRVRGHRERPNLPDCFNPLAFDDDDTVPNRRAAEAVNESATYQGLKFSIGRLCA